MVSVKMADEDAGDSRWSDIGEDELPLCPFAGIEEEAVIAPAQKIGALVAKSGGLLARAAEDRQIANGHLLSPPGEIGKARKADAEKSARNVGGVGDIGGKRDIGDELEEKRGELDGEHAADEEEKEDDG